MTATMATMPSATETNNLILIKLIKSRRPLYDSSQKDHFNKEVVEQLWSEVAMEMGQPVPEVKQRWTILRNGYVRELRIKRSSYKKKKPWVFEEAMSFLYNYIHQRKSKENPNEQHVEMVFYPNHSHLSVDSIAAEEEVVASREIIPTKKIEKFEQNKEISQSVPETSSDYFRTNKYQDDEENADIQFLRSLVPDMMKLNEKNKRKFKALVLTRLYSLIDEQEELSS